MTSAFYHLLLSSAQPPVEEVSNPVKWAVWPGQAVLSWRKTASTCPPNPASKGAVEVDDAPSGRQAAGERWDSLTLEYNTPSFSASTPPDMSAFFCSHSSLFFSSFFLLLTILSMCMCVSFSLKEHASVEVETVHAVNMQSAGRTHLKSSLSFSFPLYFLFLWPSPLCPFYPPFLSVASTIGTTCQHFLSPPSHMTVPDKTSQKSTWVLFLSPFYLPFLCSARLFSPPLLQSELPRAQSHRCAPYVRGCA